jgi:hypothetical protein
MKTTKNLTNIVNTAITTMMLTFCATNLYACSNVPEPTKIESDAPAESPSSFAEKVLYSALGASIYLATAKRLKNRY